MKIAFVFTHHRRTLNTYYVRAAKRLGHEVVSVGPWDDEQRFGTHGREPDYVLSTKRIGVRLAYGYGEVCDVLPWTPDVVWLLEGGEDLRVLNVPQEVAFVHQSVEGSHMSWSWGLTPHRYVNFTHAGHAPPDVRWLPYGFDVEEVNGLLVPMAHREYDCAQVGSPRPSRVWVWQQMMAARDIHCWFSPSLWGPAHFALYQNARVTFCNHTHDFICPRVFDAMAMGCLVASDPTPSLCSLFEDGKHFVAYQPMRGDDGEHIPDPNWLADLARHCRRDPAWAERITGNAAREVWGKHTYEHRIASVLGEVSAG